MKRLKKIAFNIGLIAMFVGRMWGQQPTTPATTSLAEQPLPAVTQVGAQYTGQPGNITYCYWVVANYAVGNAAISSAKCVNGISLSGSVVVNWQVPNIPTTLNYTLTYEVIRTTSNIFNQNCTACLVVADTSNLTVTDSLGTLSTGYSTSQYSLTNAVTTIDNTSTDQSIIYTNFKGVKNQTTIRQVTTLPTYCNIGDIVTLTSSLIEGENTFYCSGANLWKLQGGVVAAPSGAVGVYIADSQQESLGTAISSYVDNSGYGNTATATGAERVTLTTGLGNHKVFHFDGVANSITLPNSLSVVNSNCTILVIAAMPTYSLQQNRGIVSLGPTNSILLTQGLALNFRQLRAYPATSTYWPAYQPSGWNTIGVVSSIIDTYLVVNGNLYPSLYPLDGSTTSGGTIGSYNGANFLDQDIAEIRIYPRALTATELKQWYQYVQSKYGIGTSSLKTTTIAAIGDSLTAGYPPTDTTNYPNWLSGLIPNKFEVINMGSSGLTLAQMNTAASDNYLGVCNEKNAYAFVWGGTNDLNAGASAATTISRYKTFLTTLKNAGCVTFAATIIDRNVGGSFETDRATVNTAITTTFVSGGYADYIVDLAGDSRLNNYLNTTYFQPDQVHLTSAGYMLVASLFYNSLATNGLLNVERINPTFCTSSVSPAICGAAVTGFVNIPATSTSIVVNSSKVTANSIITAVFDASLGTALGVTCNATVATPNVSARVNGTSFTLSVGVAPITNPACFSYSIIN